MKEGTGNSNLRDDERNSRTVVVEIDDVIIGLAIPVVFYYRKYLNMCQGYPIFLPLLKLNYANGRI